MRVRHALCLAVVAASGASCVDVEERYVAPRVGAARLLEGGSQVTQVGSDVPVAPAILVLGRDSLPVRNIEVRFSAPDSGTSVLDAVQRTDSNGIARVGRWTVSSVPGVDTLLAVVVGVKTIVVTVTVTPPCAASAAIAFGDSASGTITDGDCIYAGGRRAVALTLTGTPLTGTTGARFTISGTGYTGRVVLERSGTPQASTIGDTATPSTLLAFLGPSSYTVLATGENAANRGAFTIRTSRLTTVVGCPPRLYITRGATTAQFIDTDACPYRDSNLNPYLAHEYRIHLVRAERIVVRMNGASLGPFILVLNESAKVILSQADVGTSTAVALAFVAPYNGYFTLAALAGATANATGAYDLTVDP